MTKVIPIFRIFDLDKTREFYVDWLGFSIDWEHRFGDNFPVYLQISKGDLIFHLSEHHGDATPGSKAYVLTTNLKEYHNQLLAKDYRYNKPGIGETPWNTLCMDVADPFGNKISFNEELNK